MHADTAICLSRGTYCSWMSVYGFHFFDNWACDNIVVNKTAFLPNTFFLGKCHNTNWWTKTNSRFHVLFKKQTRKIKSCYPYRWRSAPQLSHTDSSIMKLFFCIHPYYLCSCILICVILPKNRLITAKQRHCILIAFVTVILVRQHIQRGY